MKQSIVQSIEVLISTDNEVSSLQRDAIMRACRTSTVKRELITTKQACELLGISKVTLRQYVRRGLIGQISYSARKKRYDAEQVCRLAYFGIEGSINE